MSVPFEPIRTDEPHNGPKTNPRDFDSQMLAGCGAFVAASMLSYVIAVGPHFVFSRTYELNSLAMACGFGMVPAAILGGYATRRFGLAAAAGFVGRGLATSIFLLLRLKQVLLLEGEKNLPQPEFPQSWQYLLPGAWMLLVLLTVGLLLKREEYSVE